MMTVFHSFAIMRHSDESLEYKQIIRALLFIYFCQPVAADDHVTRRVMYTCELQYEYALIKMYEFLGFVTTTDEHCEIWSTTLFSLFVLQRTQIKPLPLHCYIFLLRLDLYLKEGRVVVLALFTSPLCEDERASDKRFFPHYFSTLKSVRSSHTPSPAYGLYACENDDNYGWPP